MRFRRLKSGYTNFGGIIVPPHAQAVVLTDRATGTLYLVSFNAGLPERLSINTVYGSIRKKEGVRVYAADDGPYMDKNGQYKLIIRAGRIGFEYTAFPLTETDVDQAPPYSRTSNAQKKLIVDENVNPLLVHIGIDTNG